MISQLGTRVSKDTQVTPVLRQATVLRVEGDGSIVVALASDGIEILCEHLVTGSGPSVGVSPDDKVLVWQPSDMSPHGVVLGRVGLGHVTDTPDTLLLEAKESLTLRVGDGSITIRADGKILIKGNELVSHAEKMNRIKGGAVAIN